MNRAKKIGMSLLMVSSAQAATPLDASQVLQFSIAKGGLTRITIENDGIDDLYVYPTEYVDNIQHHKSGHVFVVADEIDSPLYLTLITKRGLAQDLKLTPTNKKAEPLVLCFEDEATQAKELLEATRSLLEKFIQGLIPAGFLPASVLEASRGRGGLTAIVDKAYQDARYRVLIYTVRNGSRDNLTLDNQLLWEEGDLALACDHSSLDPNQSAKMFVIQKS